MRLGRLVVPVLTSLTVAAARAPRPPADQTPVVHRQRYAGYLFAYFTGEGTADGEQVYFGLSQGNDPLRWQQPGGGPALRSDVGTKGVRDPFVIRSPRGDKFFLIATDL